MFWKSVFNRLKGIFRDIGRSAGEDAIDEGSSLLERNLPVRGTEKSVDRPVDQRPNPASNKPARQIQLVIGLDFGTSFTKVIVGEERVRYAVPFGCHMAGRNKFLLPSTVCVLAGTEKCTLGTNGQGGRLYDNLKTPLIERKFCDDLMMSTTAFLALVFRHTRDWVLNEHGAIYKNRQIEWFVNVGMPTDSHDDRALRSEYLRIVRSAWHTSVMAGDITLETALDILTRDETNEEGFGEGVVGPLLPNDRFGAFPEFAAQLTGYVRSPRRREGLHVTADVGGGTIDVSVFNVFRRDGEDVYPIFASRVAPLGVRYLLDERSRSLKDISREKLSPFENLVSDADFSKDYGIPEDTLKEADKPFRRKVLDVIEGPIWHTRQHRYPEAPQWRLGSLNYGDPVPGFFCGGGALSGFYADLLKDFECRKPPFKLGSSPLPVPDDLDPSGLMPMHFLRLAVAYGLSFDALDIGRTISSAEIGYMQSGSSGPNFKDMFIGKDAV